MAASIIWTDQALDDIDAIAEYIHRDSPYHAQRVVEEILSLTASIAEQPKMGRVVPELKSPNVRERFVYSYRVIYEIRPAQIEVLAVIHGRRLLDTLEEGFD